MSVSERHSVSANYQHIISARVNTIYKPASHQSIISAYYYGISESFHNNKIAYT